MDYIVFAHIHNVVIHGSYTNKIFIKYGQCDVNNTRRNS